MSEIIIIAILGCLMVLAFYLGFVRNTQVFNLRRKVLREENHWLNSNPNHVCRSPYHFRYEALPSYDKMLWHFWTRVSTFEKKLRPIEEYHNHEA